jgi:hypothetical protein
MIAQPTLNEKVAHPPTVSTGDRFDSASLESLRPLAISFQPARASGRDAVSAPFVSVSISVSIPQSGRRSGMPHRNPVVSMERGLVVTSLRPRQPPPQAGPIS